MIVGRTKAAGWHRLDAVDRERDDAARKAGGWGLGSRALRFVQVLFVQHVKTRRLAFCTQG